MLPEANITMLAPVPAVPAAPVWDVGTDGGQLRPHGALGGLEQVGPCKERTLRVGVPQEFGSEQSGLSLPALLQQVGMSVTLLGHQPHGLFPRQLGMLTALLSPATMGRSVSHSHVVTEASTKPVTSPLSSGDGP